MKKGNRTNRYINREGEPRQCSLKFKEIAINYHLLKAFRSKDSFYGIRGFNWKIKVKHMTFHKISFIKKKRAVISLSCCHGYIKLMTVC